MWSKKKLFLFIIFFLSLDENEEIKRREKHKFYYEWAPEVEKSQNEWQIFMMIVHKKESARKMPFSQAFLDTVGENEA